MLGMMTVTPLFAKEPFVTAAYGTTSSTNAAGWMLLDRGYRVAMFPEAPRH